MGRDREKPFEPDPGHAGEGTGMTSTAPAPAPARPETTSRDRARVAMTRRADAPKDRAMPPVVFIARLVGPLFVVLGIGCL